MADTEPTTVEEPSSEGDAVELGAPGVGAEDDQTSTSFALDEDTLGRSESVFDAGVDLLAPSVPASVPPSAAVIPPVPVEAPPERALSAAERRRRVRLEARRVRRVVRHIEPWSVLKISILFYLCLWLICVLAGVLLWSFAESSGTLTSIEDLVQDLFALDQEQDFWRGGRIFRVYAVSTMILSIAGITFNVLLCVLYNLISDLTGGIRLTVIEEETARFTPPRRRTRR